MLCKVQNTWQWPKNLPKMTQEPSTDISTQTYTVCLWLLCSPWEQTSTKAASYLTVMARRWPSVMKPKINLSPSTRAKTQVLLFWTYKCLQHIQHPFFLVFWAVSNSYKAYRKKFKQLLHIKFHRNNISWKPKKFATTNFCSCNSVVNILCTNLYVMYNLFTMNSWMYMWQSRVEIEDYSVITLLHSKRRIAELLLRAGLIRSKAIEIRHGITFNFYTGLPHMVTIDVWLGMAMLKFTLLKHCGWVAVVQICLWRCQIRFYSTTHPQMSAVISFPTTLLPLPWLSLAKTSQYFLSGCHIVAESIMHRSCGAWPMRVTMSVLRKPLVRKAANPRAPLFARATLHSLQSHWVSKCKRW